MCKSMGSQRIQPCNTGENAQAASQFNTSDFNMAGEPKIVELDSDEEEIQEPGPKNAGVPAEAEKVNDAGDKVKESQPEPEPEEEDEEDEEGVGGGEYKRQTEGDIRKVLSDARASSKGLADLKAPKPKETPAEIKKKEREKAKENARKEKALARVQAQEEIVFADLFDLGLGKQATGCFMKVEIMEKVMDHWPNSKQIRVIDKTGDARSAFFYTDENEYFDLDDAKQGAVFTFRDPYLHYFMDGQMGLRIEDAKLVRLDPNASWKPQRRLEYAKAEKLEGNKWLKDKKWEEACSRYGMAVGHITDCPTANADEVAARSEVEKTIYLNMSLAFLSQEKFEETIKYCRKALDIDPKLAKAYFRMGQVLSFALVHHPDCFTKLGLHISGPCSHSLLLVSHCSPLCRMCSDKLPVQDL